MKRNVFLHVESDFGNHEKVEESNSRFKAMEAEVHYLLTMLDEASYSLKTYEQEDGNMFALNEVTRDRVFNYSSFSVVVLVALGVWQVYYLHSFFKQKVFFF